MTASTELDEQMSNWQTKTLIIGAVVGALVGLGGAYLMIQNAEKHGGRINMSAGEGVRLGVFLMGTLRQIAQIGES